MAVGVDRRDHQRNEAAAGVDGQVRCLESDVQSGSWVPAGVHTDEVGDDGDRAECQARLVCTAGSQLGVQVDRQREGGVPGG